MRLTNGLMNIPATPTPDRSGFEGQPWFGARYHLRPVPAQLVIVVGVLLSAGVLGYLSNPLILIGSVAVAAGMLSFMYPQVALILLPWAAMYLPFEIKASEAVTVNIAVIIAPLLVIVWLLRMIQARHIAIRRSRLYFPMLGLVLSATLSWVWGNVYWSPFVPRPHNLLLVQAGQWSVFLFSMLAVLLGINLFGELRWLRTLVSSYIAAGATAVVLYSTPITTQLAARLVQLGAVDSTFWVWMNSLLLGLLLVHRGLKPLQRLSLLILWILLWRLAVGLAAGETTWMSGIVPMTVSTLVMLGLYLRKRFLFLLPALVVIAVVAAPIVREQLNLDRELAVSGGGRLAHIRIVLMFALEKPWFGLGMAAYRHYTATVPQVVQALLFRGAQISAHNNYVDIFAHMGAVGLIAFAWFAATLGYELIQKARSRRHYLETAFSYAAVAAFAGILASGMLGDWFFPFVYNIGFKGMRSSIIAWVLLGAAAGLHTTKEHLDAN